jgi:AraC-like DNA-binding protein
VCAISTALSSQLKNTIATSASIRPKARVSAAGRCKSSALTRKVRFALLSCRIILSMSARCMFLSCGRLNPIRMPWSPRSYNPPQGSRRLTIPFASKDRVVAATSSLYSEIMRDYERIKAIIEFLDESRQEQPGLEELSAAAGLSPFHLHRLFSDWAGITPKAFLKCLTLNHAKELLRAGESVLSTSWKRVCQGRADCTTFACRWNRLRLARSRLEEMAGPSKPGFQNRRSDYV